MQSLSNAYLDIAKLCTNPKLAFRKARESDSSLLLKFSCALYLDRHQDSLCSDLVVSTGNSSYTYTFATRILWFTELIRGSYTGDMSRKPGSRVSRKMKARGYEMAKGFVGFNVRECSKSHG